ncbi:MAG: GatB/YqeY domain-containing protein, partial [Nitrososphaerota archaeon]|nr:GatB/YqeY domain-containing protein [Nitrososphaerota archaeon]
LDLVSLNRSVTSNSSKEIEKVVEASLLSPRFVASVLIDIFLSLSRDNVPVSTLKDERIFEVFAAISSGRFAKEAFSAVIRQIALDPGLSLEGALTKVGVGGMSKEELEKEIDEIIAQNTSLIESKGVSGSMSTLMGKVMQRVRGKVDGKIVSETLAARLAEKEKINQRSNV